MLAYLVHPGRSRHSTFQWKMGEVDFLLAVTYCYLKCGDMIIDLEYIPLQLALFWRLNCVCSLFCVPRDLSETEQLQ